MCAQNTPSLFDINDSIEQPTPLLFSVSPQENVYLADSNRVILESTTVWFITGKTGLTPTCTEHWR